MNKNVKIMNVTRNQLADPNYGMKYNERLSKSNIEVGKNEYVLKDCGNGYARLEKARL